MPVQLRVDAEGLQSHADLCDTAAASLAGISAPVATTAQDLLRGDILAYGLDDWVSLADVRGALDRRGVTPAPAERQQLILSTIRSLLVGGLVEVGVIPGRDDPGFQAWPRGVDDVMKRLEHQVVGQWSNPDEREYATWLNLTPTGEATAPG